MKKRIRKISIFVLAVTLSFYHLPVIYANNLELGENNISDSQNIGYIIIEDEDLEEIPLYGDNLRDIIEYLPHLSQVSLTDFEGFKEIQRQDDFFIEVEYYDEISDKTTIGFIESLYLYSVEEIEAYLSENLDNSNEGEVPSNDDLEEIKGEHEEGKDENNYEVANQPEENTKDEEIHLQSVQVSSEVNILEGISLKNPTYVYASQSKSSTPIRSYEQGSILRYQYFDNNWYQATVMFNGSWTTGFISANDVENIAGQSEVLTGVSNGSTPVYSRPSNLASTLRTYDNGTILRYRTFTSDWYQATIWYNGEWTTGYIHKNHVENAVAQPQDLEGVALNNPTRVYQSASTSSNVLRTYNQGTILRYKSFTSNWYQATIMYNGEWTSGYIHKNHVENSVAQPQDLEGVALNNPTRVYQSASTGSNVLRTYNQGTILRYKSFTSNWYQATIMYNGEWTSGYIHKNHVENAVAQPQDLEGVALNNPTRVYQSASTGSNVLRTYNQGTILRYKSFTSNWYQATIMYNGEWTSGYIHKNHVENAVAQPQDLEGVALNNPTRVYQSASTSSSVLRTYNQGTVLRYKSFTSNWYQATIMYNGEWTSGYIHKNHVENIYENRENLDGYASKNPTMVYSKASRDSTVLRSYNKGNNLRFKTFSPSWYEATVMYNGNWTTGYIHKDDISFESVREIRIINYNYSFSSIVDRQMARTPKADGSGNIAAGRNLVEYYANPSNFPEGTNGFFQFLVLSSPAGLDAAEVNSKILNSSTGTLEGTAQAFIDAGKRYNVNEAYLIAHALHETGNGKSELASGVQIHGRTVYNMYGTAAYDGSAVSSGAQYAYDKGWFTPEAAIIGGAEFIARNYIAAGQDTLYKMRWNPDNPGHHQYATHVAWAHIPANRIANIYNSLENYVLTFEVPQFQNQPGYAGPTPPANNNEVNFPSGSIGVTSGSNVRFRSSPSTTSSIITTLSNIGTQLELLGSNNQGWYKARYNGQTGWISEEYVNALNVLEITASSLNVRSSPSTSGNIVGSLSSGTIVRAVLDSKNNYVTSNEWYKIYYNNSESWISSGTNHSYIRIR